MVKKTNNWLICGTSPFAVTGTKCNYNLIDRGIDFDKFITVALNWFPVKCDYRFIVDCGAISYMYQNGEKLVIPKELLPGLKYYNNVGKEDLIINPHYTYTIGNELNCVNSVCEPAIEYAHKQGADNIVLFGVDLTDDWQSKERTDVTKGIISKYDNIYTLNKQSGIGVPIWTEINLN